MARTSTPPPPPLRLYFVRHGESEANQLHVFSNRDLPHGLTEKGRAQTERLAGRVRGTAFTAMYASPVLRARQSAEILSTRLHLDFVTTPALAEFDVGVLEGLSDPASWRQYETLLDAWLVRRDWRARIEGGESFDDIRARFMPFIDSLRRERPGGPVLMIGHGGMLICMLPQLLSNVTPEFARERSIGHAEVVIAESRDNHLVCTSWGGSGQA
jgi:probable phosphoglycerate mutase